GPGGAATVPGPAADPTDRSAGAHPSAPGPHRRAGGADRAARPGAAVGLPPAQGLPGRRPLGPGDRRDHRADLAAPGPAPARAVAGLRRGRAPRERRGAERGGGGRRQRLLRHARSRLGGRHAPRGARRSRTRRPDRADRRRPGTGGHRHGRPSRLPLPARRAVRGARRRSRPGARRPRQRLRPPHRRAARPAAHHGHPDPAHRRARDRDPPGRRLVAAAQHRPGPIGSTSPPSSEELAVSDVEWHSVALAPIVLVHGTETLIADRAVQRLRGLAREADPSVAVHELSGDALGPGTLGQVASPSLFGEPRFVLVPELQAAPDSLVGELLDYLKTPEQGVTLVLVHRGGNRGKKLLAALKKAGVPRADASPVKRAGDKQTFVAAEFARAQRRIQPEALIALVDAFGTDLAELAAISRQLIEDTTPEPGEQPAQVSVAD